MGIRNFTLAIVAGAFGITGCESLQPTDSIDSAMSVGTDQYAVFRLQADLGDATAEQRRMLAQLIEAAKVMDDLFWRQAYGPDYQSWLQTLSPAEAKLARINYGPWDRLNGDAPFIDGVGAKPLGARFYPADMTKAEFEAWDEPDKKGLYSLVQRKPNGELTLVPFHDAYEVALVKASNHLRNAAGLTPNSEFARYLTRRADALVSDDYQPSDLTWMDMKVNDFDVVIGAIETYEDQLFGYRAAYEAYVLKKDARWSAELARFADFLPDLQRGLPVPAAYKAEQPGSDSDLNAYEVLYYAGHSNAGSKTIAINLPNDEYVQLNKGTRRLQLKNAMRAKFEKILRPITEELITPEQRKHVTFDAFFANTMFHEVAHGLGIKNTVDGSGGVRSALKDVASSMEEGKADVLGLYMITELHRLGELGDADLTDNYVTFLASIFRSTRFGASSAHGKANMVRFNFFRDAGAFTRDQDSGTYSVDMTAMHAAMEALSARILVLQGDGDYQGAQQLTNELGVISSELADDLARLASAGIPVDIVFEQGVDVLGL